MTDGKPAVLRLDLSSRRDISALGIVAGDETVILVGDHDGGWDQIGTARTTELQDAVTAQAEAAFRRVMDARRETIDATFQAGEMMTSYGYSGLLGRTPRDLPEGTMTRQRRRAEERAARKGRRVD